MKSLIRYCSFLCCIAFISCQKELPNVILIMADDMGAECLSIYGGTTYETPNMEKMAEEGMWVTQCISQPLCTPSRLKLMTGLYNSRNYTHFGRLDTSWLNIGTLMKEAGYSTCISGKWQLNGLAYKDEFVDWNDPTRPQQMGFEEYCLWQLTRQRSEGERFSKPLIEQNGKVLETDRDDYGPDIFADYILDFIDRKAGQPFFIYYPMVLVHDPFVPTPDSEAWNDPERRYENDTVYFADMMNYTDKIVGRIRNKLKEAGELENTLIIFTADNGTHPSIYSQTRNRRVRGAKGNTISDGVHVPLIMSWPEKVPGEQVFDGLIEFSDFFATMADLVDREVQTDGRSFLPLLEGSGFEERKTARVHYDPRWGANVNKYRNVFVQTPSHKLYQDGSFYNLNRDILEETPLAPSKLDQEEMSIMEELRAEMFPSAERPPNLLLIITDDQGYGDLSLHGHSILETPNMDAIGKEGVRLDNFHVSPVCAPTRAAILTGRRPLSTGTYWVTRGGETMDEEEYTLAEILKDNGYSTGYFGKWHNGSHHPNHPISQGFDEFYGFTGGHWNNYFDPELEHNGQMVRQKGYIADLFTDRAIEYIEKEKDNPFFCYLAYNTPHSPFQLPDNYYDMYIDRVKEESEELKIMNASVYGMVKNIDDNMGRLMSTLRKLDLDEHTIVVFLTDNGPNTERFNGEMKGRKAWVNDGGVRVPCFIKWKGHIPENKIVSSMTAHIDLLPTLTTLMGAEFAPQNAIHGLDLSPRILGVDMEEDRILYTHVNNGPVPNEPPGAVRTDKWRLTFTDPENPELTLRKDFREAENLAEAYPLVTDSLIKVYYQWFSEFRNLKIPPIPVGVIDSVHLFAHEAFCHGDARYFWSANGWSNDWVVSLDMEKSRVHWNLDIRQSGTYNCVVRYTSSQGKAVIQLETQEQMLQNEVAQFIPVKDPNYSRIDRKAEAISQTWARHELGTVFLEEGGTELMIHASDPNLEILDVTLLKK